MAEENEAQRELFISFHPYVLSLPDSLSQAWQWAASLHWWEWLLMTKAVILLWVLNITIILPSIFMQVSEEAERGREMGG